MIVSLGCLYVQNYFCFFLGELFFCLQNAENYYKCILLMSVHIHCSPALILESLHNKRSFVFIFGREHNIPLTCQLQFGKGHLNFVASQG